jgi:hypothetical protein
VSLELADLYFGRDDAELDIADGGLLLAGFLRTPAYDAARKERKHLIIGRKGSGKSAICRTLAAGSEPELVTALVTPDSLSADEIRRFELQGVESVMAKRMLWRYVLAIQVAKHLVAHAKADHRKAVPASIGQLRTFLADNGELEESRPKLYEIIGKLKGTLKLQAFGISLEIGASSEGTRTDYQLELIERHIESAIKELACPADHPRLLVLVDQLEEVWSEEGDSGSFVIGLLKASRATGARFPGVSCIVFLRSDIYSQLKFADKDKYHGDEMHVDWSAERLRELALARARASLGTDMSEERLWSEIFPASISASPSSEYIINHTLMRPRDMIHLCNLCRDTAEGNGHSRITEADVAEAVRLYSRWKLEDLPNEYITNYPFLDALLAIFKDHGYIVTRTALNLRLPEAVQALVERFPDQAEALTTESILEVLYEVGFIGVCHNHHIIYAASHGGRIDPADTEFHIHPAFRPALRAGRAFVTRNYEPGELRKQVKTVLSAGLLVGLASAYFESRLVRNAQIGIDRLLSEPGSSHLPHEVEQEVSRNLWTIMKHLRALNPDRSPTHTVIEQIDQMQKFICELADRLEADGFAVDNEARNFIRSISDVGNQMRRELRGISTGPESG